MARVPIRSPNIQSYPNGWLLEKRPNTFAEQYLYILYCVDAEGYTIARKGFQAAGTARIWAQANYPPTERVDPKKVTEL